MSRTAIRFDCVSKKFPLERERPRSIQEAFLSLRRRRRRQREMFWVLRDVDFEIAHGETVAIIGPNGAGKSTVLKLVARILEPTSGSISVNGQVAALLELGAGFHPDLTGRENVFLNGAVLGISRKEMHSRFDEIVDFSELEPFIDIPVKHYSSGMYMRLAFAVAVTIDPEILLVDEILAVGDSAFQRKCMDRIYDLRREGVTILMVSHSLDAVTRICSRAIWLEKAVIVGDGSAWEISRDYLERVNARDQERLHQESAKRSAAAVRNRRGSGEIRITEIECLDGQGNATTVLRTGDPLTVRLHYRADEIIERPVFGVALYRDDDLHVSGPNSRMGNLTIPTVRGTGYVDYVIEHLPLMAGHYDLAASIYDETITHQYDFVRLALSFTVQPRTSWDTLGVVHLPARWVASSEPTHEQRSEE
jgi:ABC-type polysaccharide/polyol phosphate transport system ATPase subunit